MRTNQFSLVLQFSTMQCRFTKLESFSLFYSLPLYYLLLVHVFLFFLFFFFSYPITNYSCVFISQVFTMRAIFGLNCTRVVHIILAEELALSLLREREYFQKLILFFVHREQILGFIISDQERKIFDKKIFYIYIIHANTFDSDL